MSSAAASPGFICKLKERTEVAEGTGAKRAKIAQISNLRYLTSGKGI